MAWQHAAACRDEDSDLFFPIGTGPATTKQIKQAKAVCSGCPVRAKCLQDALDKPHKYGIWGGTDEEQRKSMRRRQQRRDSARNRRSQVR
jgi:WhiB family redox-sensing transcriptional regulator